MTYYPAAYPAPEWPGETVFILGGGPSLRGFDVERLRGRKVIGINESGLSLCPWADVLFWADMRWIQWNSARIGLHTGEYRYTCQKHLLETIPRARYIEWRARLADRSGDVVWNAFATEKNCLGGFDSGSRCINLAWHTGASRVVLLGFDMRDYPEDEWRKGNWHGKHALPPLPGQRKNKFIPAHDRMAAEIKRLELDFEVLNATPDTALTCWPAVKLESVL